jgi:hypothetical protein
LLDNATDKPCVGIAELSVTEHCTGFPPLTDVGHDSVSVGAVTVKAPVPESAPAVAMILPDVSVSTGTVVTDSGVLAVSAPAGIVSVAGATHVAALFALDSVTVNGVAIAVPNSTFTEPEAPPTTDCDPGVTVSVSGLIVNVWLIGVPLPSCAVSVVEPAVLAGAVEIVKFAVLVPTPTITGAVNVTPVPLCVTATLVALETLPLNVTVPVTVLPPVTVLLFGDNVKLDRVTLELDALRSPVNRA